MMFAALHLALKDLRLLSRDRMALFWAGVFPVIFALFIGSVLSSSVSQEDAKVTLAVVDEASSEASKALIDQLESNDSVVLDLERDVASAEARVRRGESLGYLKIPAGYGREPDRSVEVGMDPSRASEAALLRASVTAAVVRVRAESLAGAAPAPSGSGASAADAPPSAKGSSPATPTAPSAEIALKKLETLGARAPRSSFDLVFPAAILWGLMGCAATFAVAMVSERTAGTFIRLRAAPIGRTAILTGKALACAIACVVVAVVLSAIARIGFGVQTDRPAMLGLAIGSVSLCFVGLTMFLSTLGKTEAAVSGAGWAVLLLMAMLGGAMVPVSFMPEWMQRLSDLSPVKWGIFALEGALWRGLSLRELALPCGILLGIGTAGFVLGLSLLKRSERTA